MNKRLVISTKDGLTFTGTEFDLSAINKEDYLIIELDEKAGLKLMIPYSSIQEKIEIELPQPNLN